jgi:hypothetical protein
MEVGDKTGMGRGACRFRMAPAGFGAGFGTPIPAPGPSSLPRHPPPYPPSGPGRHHTRTRPGLPDPTGTRTASSRSGRAGLRGRTALEEKGLAWSHNAGGEGARAVALRSAGTTRDGGRGGTRREVAGAGRRCKRRSSVRWRLIRPAPQREGERAAAGGSPGGGACDSSREETESGQRWCLVKSTTRLRGDGIWE